MFLSTKKGRPKIVLNNKSRHKKFFLVKQFLKVNNYDIFVLFAFLIEYPLGLRPLPLIQGENIKVCIIIKTDARAVRPYFMNAPSLAIM